jgi:uncharacterized protein YecT (DUF1311 family)
LTIERAKELMGIELECIKRNEHEDCDRNCAVCPLVQDTQELIAAYKKVISYLDSASKFYGG